MPLKEHVHSVGIRWNLCAPWRLCIVQVPIMSTRRRPESIAFIRPARGRSEVAPSRCSGEPRWPPSGRPHRSPRAVTAPGAARCCTVLTETPTGAIQAAGAASRGHLRRVARHCLKGTCEASNRAEKGLQRRRGSRPSTRLCDRAERPRFVPGHQRLGPECAALGPSAYTYAPGLDVRCLAIKLDQGPFEPPEARASAHPRGHGTAPGAVHRPSTHPMGSHPYFGRGCS